MTLTKAREAAGLTRARLGALASIHPARVGQFENRRAVPYPVELGRIAEALEYAGEPETLLEEAGSDGAAA